MYSFVLAAALVTGSSSAGQVNGFGPCHPGAHGAVPRFVPMPDFSQQNFGAAGANCWSTGRCTVFGFQGQTNCRPVVAPMPSYPAPQVYLYPPAANAYPVAPHSGHAVPNAGYAAPNAAPCTSAPSSPRIVYMTAQRRFDPTVLTIRQGETVVWMNAGTVTHTVTADARLARSTTSVALPPGAEPFHSGDVQPGGRYSRTFHVPGRYRYFCMPHELEGMVAELIVLPVQ